MGENGYMYTYDSIQWLFTWNSHNTLSYGKTEASLVAQLVKNLPAMQETLVRFLGREDLLEKGQATHSSILRLPLWLSW